MRRRLPLVLAILLGSFGLPAAAAPQFVGLDDLPGGLSLSRATAVSNGGAVVVGTGTTATGSAAFRWTAADGLQTLGPLPPGLGPDSEAHEVSNDGNVIVGTTGLPVGFGQGFVWTQASGVQSLGNAPGFDPLGNPRLYPLLDGSAVSPNGRYVAGYLVDGDGSRAFAKELSTGIIRTFGADIESVTSVSNEGLTTYAIGQPDRGEQTGFDGTTRPIGIGNAGAYFFGRASADGNIVVGTAVTNIISLSRWTPSEGVVPISDRYGVAKDVSDDGTVIVGFFGDPNGSDKEAVLWTAAAGTRSLASLLRDDYGVATAFAGWTDTAATAVSGDGVAIAGYGTNPEGHVEAWLVLIPEPATMLLVASGLALLGALRRNHG